MRHRTASCFPSWLVLIATVLICGCSPREETLPNTVTTALAAAFTRGDPEGCAALYTDDAVILSENAPAVRGRRAIAAFFHDQVARDILFSTDSDVSLVSGNLGVDQGTYRVRDTRRGMDVEYGDYLNVWRKTNGEWRVFRSMYNVTSAPRAGVTVSPDDSSAPR
jgi:ketosteroid isomerase-like protein